MKQKLRFVAVLVIASYSSSAQDALVQKIGINFSYSNYSKYRLNTQLANQGIPEIKTNRVATGFLYEIYYKNWLMGGRFSTATGKNSEHDITTKSRLWEGELQVGHQLFKKKDFSLYGGVGFVGATNTITIFQEPKPTISLNNLLGANNNLIIRNESYNAGVFMKALLFQDKPIAPYLSVGYYMPLLGTKWKADDTQIIDNIKEKPFIFNITLGFSLWNLK